MAFKFITFALLVAAANAGLLPTQVLQPTLLQQRYISQPQLAIAQPQLAVAQPLLAKQVRVEDYDANPQYSFAYDVQDSLTGDSKSQQETRNGDLVQGQYSLIDADGYQRIVSYTADSVNGFNAVVQREPLVAKTVVKGVVAQPTLLKTVVAQPQIYSQPQIIAQQQPIYRSAISQPILTRSSIGIAQPQLLRSPYTIGHL